MDTPGTGAVRRAAGLLRQRNFRLLWIGETISSGGDAMAVVGMPLLAVTVLHASTVAVAAITASAYLPWLIIGLPAGAWVDRLPGRRLMITCDIMSFAFYASLPASARAGELTIAQVIAVALAAGSVSVLFTTAYRVLLPSLVAPEELIEGNANSRAARPPPRSPAGPPVGSPRRRPAPRPRCSPPRPSGPPGTCLSARAAR